MYKHTLGREELWKLHAAAITHVFAVFTSMDFQKMINSWIDSRTIIVPQGPTKEQVIRLD